MSTHAPTDRLVVLDDGRFVSWLTGKRTFVREYPDASLFRERGALEIAQRLRAEGTPCRVMSVEEYEQS